MSAKHFVHAIRPGRGSMARMRLPCGANQLAEDSRERCSDLVVPLDLADALISRLQPRPADWRAFLTGDK